MPKIFQLVGPICLTPKPEPPMLPPKELNPDPGPQGWEAALWPLGVSGESPPPEELLQKPGKRQQ